MAQQGGDLRPVALGEQDHPASETKQDTRSKQEEAETRSGQQYIMRKFFVARYDFIMLCCQQIQKVPLNFVDRICRGPFVFPQKSLDKREGEGLRIHWDKLREASFLTRWNPMTSDLPYTTFIDHPLSTYSEKFSAISQISLFNEELVKAVQESHRTNPVPGRANGALILNQPLLIETYVGIMSFIGNRNKLGYSLARGSVGF
ncbi:hypothetical protein GDO81_007718 [Engystomops pustulosus]|uniref:HSac2 domain-containing protein n=1 Tax=Engystomops pustulosus TaxID=76066 RepID=A0AAV7CAA6_ENGPU|nr:hypothetical protein GDO81_007718 [Engystomops pustulosus]